MNVFRQGPVTQSPYQRTAFRVGRVPKEVVRHRAVVQMLAQTRQLVGDRPDQHTIAGRAVTLAELNAAEQVLLKPERRILEELLEHAAEKPPLERIKQLSKEARRALAEGRGDWQAVRTLEALRPWSAALVRCFLDSVPGPDPALGALELDLVPPFGGDEER
jgi:hypothetical protein